MKKLCPLLLLLAFCLPAVAVPASDDPLLQMVSALDTKLFAAYNRCDLDALGAMVADDLEFYHDQSGLAVGRQPFLDSTRRYICGKVTRELVPGTLEVYPLKGYGAVEIGVHRFHHPGEQSRDEVGEAKFVMLWKQTKDGWRLARVISYSHVAAK